MSRIVVPVTPMAGHVNPMLRVAEVLHERGHHLTTDQKQIVDTVSAIFTAARADDVAMFDSVIAPDFYIFDVGARFNGDSVIASIKALHAAASVMSGTWPSRMFTSAATRLGSPMSIKAASPMLPVP
jgi:hypothetical protein